MAKAKKGAPVKLSPEKLQELKDAIIAGESPKSIHERLGASIFNIHYHKGELKKKGLLGGTTVTAKKAAAPAKKAAVKSVTPVKKAKQAKVAATPNIVKVGRSKSLKLIVNGVNISIDGAGAVSVGKEFIKIDY